MFKQTSDKKYDKQPLKHSKAPPNLDMFMMVEIKDFKIIYVKMHAIVE